jgi:hypothetical protein
MLLWVDSNGNPLRAYDLWSYKDTLLPIQIRREQNGYSLASYKGDAFAFANGGKLHKEISTWLCIHDAEARRER